MSTSNLPSQTIANAPRLDLKLEALGVLQWPKLITEDVVVSSRVRVWHEHSATVGEQWLRRSAEEGDWYAMESLALRLINGDGMQKSQEEGFGWLRKSAELGNPIAMGRLAECLLDSGQGFRSSVEAEEWFQKAIDNGNRQAAIAWGTRLITGSGLPSDPDRGKRLLVRAAQAGSRLAHIKLGAYLLSGRGLAQNREEGLWWLRRVGVTQPSQLSLLNYYVYMKSLAAPTQGESHLLAEEAGILFFESAQQGNSADEVNLAYLLRRGEISAEPYPSLDTLLSPHLQKNKPFALINQALRLAKGVQCDVDWQLADILVGKIQSADGVLEWWSARSEEGDAEGHLVTGWLVRRQRALDPEQLSFPYRMGLARAGAWAVPEWMDHAASSQKS